MSNNKLKRKNFIEVIFLCFVLFFIILNGILKNDSIIAIISAICGITYTFIAGKGKPICYLFGVTGSGFYSFLSYQNALWGNLFLYLLYYIPMQVLGFFKWNKNLKENKKEIIKTKLSSRELKLLSLFSIFLIILISLILNRLGDSHPILDSATTVLSICGMYLTVKRAIEQWLCWLVVNLLSLIMWINVALTGARVYSTIIMWSVYLFLAIYFYYDWQNEIKQNQSKEI